MHEPSKHFDKAFFGCAGGSPVVDCGCGRTCFGELNNDIPGSELDELKAKAKAEPNKYDVHVGCDTVSFAEVLGRTYVWGCPCEYFKRVESALWENRHQILAYIGARNADAAAEAQETETALAQASG